MCVWAEMLWWSIQRNRLVQGEVDSTVCDVSQTLSLRQMSKYRSSLRCTDDSADASRHVYGRRIGILPSPSTKYIFSNFPIVTIFLHLSAHISRITHSSFTWKKLQLNSRWGEWEWMLWYISSGGSFALHGAHDFKYFSIPLSKTVRWCGSTRKIKLE